MANNPMNRVLETKMNRREFLAYSGSLALVVTGVSGVIKAITQTSTRSSGYGSSPYGGNSQNTNR